MGVPKNGWFIMENPTKIGMIWGPLFQETSIYQLDLKPRLDSEEIPSTSKHMLSRTSRASQTIGSTVRQERQSRRHHSRTSTLQVRSPGDGFLAESIACSLFFGFFSDEML